MKTYLLEIVTPQRLAFSEEVEAVYAPTPDGIIGVLAHHMPLFTLLTDGEVHIKSKSKDYFLAIAGGFMDITRDKVTILVSRAVHADEINEQEIEKARKSALDAINRQATGVQLEEAQAILRRSLLESKVLRRHRSRSGITV